MDNGDPEILLNSISRYYRFLTDNRRRNFSQREWGRCLKQALPKTPRLTLDSTQYAVLHRQVLERDKWRCQACGSMQNLEVHHIQFRSQSGSDTEQNLIALCATCHRQSHGE
jgi:5-methylcytosine-specific restriction endonuclease McrA